jgi:hypothetical protein
VAASVLDDLGAGGDDARADELARARAVRLVGLPPERAFQRLTGFLIRRGHPPDAARRAARHALELEAGAVDDH